MPAGDLLSLLPGLRQVWKDTGKKWIIHQRIDVEYGDMFEAYPGATYSIKNSEDKPVTMNFNTFFALRPLIKAQEYIEECVLWRGEDVDYDMDLLRQMDTTMPFGSISRWPWYIWPEMACDLAEPWLDVGKNQKAYKDCILINRTERYNNMLISYSFLKKYGKKVFFIGLPEEHEKFCKQHYISIERARVNDFEDIAAAMRNCKLYIGNQSACFQICEGLKTPRLLECCRQMPNVIGCGPNFYDFINQKSLEYYVDKLYNN
jgi:hypothetical protein